MFIVGQIEEGVVRAGMRIEVSHPAGAVWDIKAVEFVDGPGSSSAIALGVELASLEDQERWLSGRMGGQVLQLSLGPAESVRR